MKVDLFYLTPNPYGGWVTYTSHLMDALEAVGVEASLFKVRPKSEKKTRDYGYGKRYRNISMEEALSRNNPRLILAGAKQFKEETKILYDAGASIVVHDPTELKNLPELDYKRCVVIRKIGARSLPGATFIRHPYSPFPMKDIDYAAKQGAVSTSRIDFDKHTDILLDANRLLKDPINIRGFENRLYTRFKIVPNYPEWEQSKAHYPREENFAFNLMKEYLFSVDMTQIVGDGGGTQYTTLEAWNAGCIPIIHEEWILDKPDDMKPGQNCFVVNGPEDLVDVLEEAYDIQKLDSMRITGQNALKKHSPKVIGQQYKEFLTSCT
tara:strand:- start:1877 stop:2845 length:969 start_codon:yes stop_codon:yes gene_type:complete